MNIAVIGTGYVGLVTGACLANLGHRVICVDNNLEKIDLLRNGKMPIYEAGLEAIVKTNVLEERLFFSYDIKEAVEQATVIFICVGTPPKPDGSADLESVKRVIQEISSSMNGYKLIVEKSTVPIQTGEWLEKLVRQYTKEEANFDIASNPEFLREGKAVYDFMFPDRIIIGVNSERAATVLIKLYTPLNAPILVTDINSAELIKHASNAFLAMKISFINMVANICEASGADISKVAKGIGLDKRIGSDFLQAGIGYGGFCFPKDLSAFMAIADKLGVNDNLLKSIEEINNNQRITFVQKIEKAAGGSVAGKRIGLLGLAFKPDTDDIREAPSITIAAELLKRGAGLIVYDPVAADNFRQLFPNLDYAQNAYETASKSDVLAILTEWEEFKHLDFLKIKAESSCRVIVDGRNLYEPRRLAKLGFSYQGIGRI